MNNDTAESQGKNVLDLGPPDAATVLVLDSRGLCPDGEVPEAWRRLVRRLRLLWFQLPELEDVYVDVRAELERCADEERPALVVSDAECADTAVTLAAQRPEAVQFLGAVCIDSNRSAGDVGSPDSPRPWRADPRLLEVLAGHDVDVATLWASGEPVEALAAAGAVERLPVPGPPGGGVAAREPATSW